MEQYPFTLEQSVSEPDWQIFIKGIAKLMIDEQNPKKLLEIQNRFYFASQILSSCWYIPLFKLQVHLWKFVGVLVLAESDTVVGRIKLLEKVEHGLGFVLVTVKPLEIIEVEVALGRTVEEIRGFWLGC